MVTVLSVCLWPAWREGLRRWRARQGLGGEAGDPAQSWAGECVTGHKILLWDQRFFDRRRHRWRVDGYVDAFTARFGPMDAAILWHAYPNLGFDRRNQFDFYRRMPGGLAGLGEAVGALRERGVRVFLALHPWDRATRPEGQHEAIAGLVAELDADGLYLDTLAAGDGGLRAALDRAKAGVALQSQMPPPPQRLREHAMSWTELWPDGEAPAVLPHRWLHRRHMTHVVRRWAADRRPALQLAWMNGAGVAVWENVFGSWNGCCPRDACWLRLVSAARRRFRRHFGEGEWLPLAAAPGDGVFASRWTWRGRALWTLVNRRDAWRRAVPLAVAAPQAASVLEGRALEVRGGRVRLDLAPLGMAGVLEGEAPGGFLSAQREAWLALTHAADGAPARAVRAVMATEPPAGAGAPPDGMVAVAGGPGRRRVAWRRRECGLYRSERAPEWAGNALPGLHAMARAETDERLAPFAIDRRAVSNGDFARFLAASGWRPRHGTAFLEHWRGGRVPAGDEDAPAVWLDLDDARAYAAWLGRRLPREGEWQRAAELGLLEGGGVWNWTEPVRSDGASRFCIVKGGCDFAAGGSPWYADGGRRGPEFAARYLLLWAGLDRCGTVGFRTAVDVVGGSG